MVDLDHEWYMERAFELAREAGERGDEPFGAVLVDPDAGTSGAGPNGEIVMEEKNAVNTADDVRRHPELTLAQRAARAYEASVRANLVMYTSTEPCAMCAGGVYISGIGAVVYSVPAERAATIVGGGVVPSADVFGRGERDVEVVGPVLQSEGEHIHEAHWPVSD